MCAALLSCAAVVARAAPSDPGYEDMDTLLADKGLAGFFSHVYGGDAFPRKKPDPMPLLETCKALGTTPARTLMLGDSQNDALAARAA